VLKPFCGAKPTYFEGHWNLYRSQWWRVFCTQISATWLNPCTFHVKSSHLTYITEHTCDWAASSLRGVWITKPFSSDYINLLVISKSNISRPDICLQSCPLEAQNFHPLKLKILAKCMMLESLYNLLAEAPLRPTAVHSWNIVCWQIQSTKSCLNTKRKWVAYQTSRETTNTI
jgi:hypothetical protein